MKVKADSRGKGKRGELEVAKLLEAHGFEARRGQQHRGGPGTPDVIHSIIGVHIEVKRTERFRMYAALHQAEVDGAEDEIPVVFHRTNGHKWVAILYADDYLALEKELAK